MALAPLARTWGLLTAVFLLARFLVAPLLGRSLVVQTAAPQVVARGSLFGRSLVVQTAAPQVVARGSLFGRA